jgi:NDP-sugar pyrophosphorylase family protein
MKTIMDLVIIDAVDSLLMGIENRNTQKHILKIGSEYLVERLIRVALENDIRRVFCIINDQEYELKEYLTKTDFGIPVNLIIKNTQSSLHSLIALAPSLEGNRFCVAAANTLFDEREFTEYYNYSLLQNEAAGVLSIIRYADDEKPLCVALDEADTIIKFSDVKDGYNWAAGGLYIFSPEIFDEADLALNAKISSLRDYLKMLIERGYLLKGFAFSKIIDIDHVPDIKETSKFFCELK